MHEQGRGGGCGVGFVGGGIGGATMKPTMKKKPITNAPILFPVPTCGSALAAEVPQFVPAFPVGRSQTGNDLMIAVPVLLMIPDGNAVGGIAESIATACEIVRTSQVFVGDTPMDYRILANVDELQTLPHPSVRSGFLARMIEAASATAQAMVEAGHDPQEIERVSREALEVLHLLNATGYTAPYGKS